MAVLWIDACESGFFHRFLRQFMLLISADADSIENEEVPNLNPSHFVSLLVEIFQSQLSSLKDFRSRRKESVERGESKREEDFAQRNRLIMIQELLHLIGTTSHKANNIESHRGIRGVSWLKALSCVAEVGKLSLSNLHLDTEFSCAYMIKQLIAIRAILTELLLHQDASSLLSEEYRANVESFSRMAESLLLRKEKSFYKKTLEELALVVAMYCAQLLRNQSIVFISQSMLSYLQFYGQQTIIDGLLALLTQRHHVHYELHLSPQTLSRYADFLGEVDRDDATLGYHQMLELERLLSILVETVLVYVRSEEVVVVVVVEALELLTSFLTRQLGCLFEVSWVVLYNG